MRFDKHTLWCDWKKQYVTMMWPFEDIFHRTKTVKIWTDIMNEDNRILWSSICSLVELLCVLKEKISLICWQLPHGMHGTEIFEFNLPMNFLNFLSSRVNLLGIFTSWEKLRAFKKNPCSWNSHVMPWRPMI